METEVDVSVQWGRSKSGLHRAYITIHDMRSKEDVVEIEMSAEQFSAMLAGGNRANPAPAEFHHPFLVGLYRQEITETFEVTPSCVVLATIPRPGPLVEELIEDWLNSLPIVGDEDWGVGDQNLNADKTAWVVTAYTYTDTDLPSLERRRPVKALPA